jgi:hypothetical protein
MILLFTGGYKLKHSLESLYFCAENTFGELLYSTRKQAPRIQVSFHTQM